VAEPRPANGFGVFWVIKMASPATFPHSRPYEVCTTERLNTVLQTINLPAVHSFLKGKEEKLNITDYIALSLA